ncbi:MAG: HAD family hydrolase [Gemmatimonadetes bacterium]|nr:HAD family hydrolase [Gemmatimonadota bacterium]
MGEAVLFDLDDTLVDLQYARRQGLRAVQEILPALKPVPLEELELVHDEKLRANYWQMMEGSLSDEEAGREHMRGICRHYGLETDAAVDAAAGYHRALQENSRLVPGVEALLDSLRGRMKIGVVTNGQSRHQRDKLEFFDLLPLDALSISEEVGAAKPDPQIFQSALVQLGVRTVTMIGDSWENDILGATTSGMAAVWLNRYRRTCPDPSLAVEIGGFEPMEHILQILESTSKQKD